MRPKKRIQKGKQSLHRYIFASLNITNDRTCAFVIINNITV